MISRRSLLAGVLLLAASPALALAQTPDPLAIVRSIYQKGDRYGAAAVLEVNAAKRGDPLSQSLSELWTRSDKGTAEGDEAPPGFDITTNSQGMEVGKADIKIEKQDAARATVVARLTPATPWTRKSPAENVVRYDFVRESGRWKIDNVRSTIDGKEWTIKGILNEGMDARLNEDKKK